MKSDIKKVVITLVLFFLSISTGYLFVENQNKDREINQLNKTNEKLEEYNSLFKMGTATEFIDIQENKGEISMIFLYQDKEVIERHSVGAVVNNQYYRIGIAPEIGVSLNEDSKILKIEDNIIEFTFDLDNRMAKYRLIVNQQRNDMNFKLEEIY